MEARKQCPYSGKAFQESFQEQNLISVTKENSSLHVFMIPSYKSMPDHLEVKTENVYSIEDRNVKQRNGVKV